MENPRRPSLSITCPQCDKTSYNRNDIREGYCGYCRWWTSDPSLYEPWKAERAEQQSALEAVRAQRWHDTDHGPDRKPPSKDTRFRTPVDEPEPEWISPCFCCCKQCDPDWELLRPNPYWTLTRPWASATS